MPADIPQDTFQSTLPCGSDTTAAKLSSSEKVFQSTLPCRSDIDARGGTRYTEISIHAPLRERQFDRAATSVAHVFQSTLPHGSDVTRTPEMVAAEMFQSTLPYGSDFLIASPALPMPDFNPHSLTGATFSSNASSTSSAFQSTLPYGSDQCQQGNTA